MRKYKNAPRRLRRQTISRMTFRGIEQNKAFVLSGCLGYNNYGFKKALSKGEFIDKVREIVETDSLYRLQKEDSEKLAILLTECFEHDPLYCELIPRRELRKKLLPAIFSCDLEEMFENSEIYADSPEVNGIIVVSDETEPYNPLQYYFSQLFYSLKTAYCLVRDDPTLKTFFNFIRGRKYLDEDWTKDIGEERRLHIIYFAVRPSKRGKGIATKLMQPVLQYADQHRLLTSLETHNEKNIGMYQHYGFRVFEILQNHSKLRQCCMIR